MEGSKCLRSRWESHKVNVSYIKMQRKFIHDELLSSSGVKLRGNETLPSLSLRIDSESRNSRVNKDQCANEFREQLRIELETCSIDTLGGEDVSKLGYTHIAWRHFWSRFDGPKQFHSFYICIFSLQS